MRKRKHKAPQMPAWFWYGIVDGCWCCKNHHNCNQCKEVRKYRKQHFPPKEKSRHAEATKEKKKESFSNLEGKIKIS